MPAQRFAPVNAFWLMARDYADEIGFDYQAYVDSYQTISFGLDRSELVAFDAGFGHGIFAGGTDYVITAHAVSVDMGTGDDYLAIFEGHSERIVLGDGDDSLFVGGTADEVHGGAGDDVIMFGNDAAGPAVALVDTGAGADRLTAAGTLGVLRAGEGDDDILVGGAATADLGSGNDRFQATGTVGVVFAGDGDDTVYLNAGGMVFGGGGDDATTVRDGSAIVLGQAGDDTATFFADLDGDSFAFFGGAGNDTARLVVTGTPTVAAMLAILDDFEVDTNGNADIEALGVILRDVETVEIEFEALGLVARYADGAYAFV